ncbi:MAG: lipid II flippase Amj family protein [Bacillota bacterium]
MIEGIYKLIFLTLIVHLIDTLAYAVRLNAVRSQQFALSTSLFNVFVLISRTANTLQGPLIGSMIGISILKNIDPILEMRKVIFASTLGTILGIIFIPTFLKVFSKAVDRLELTGSVPSIIVQALSIHNIKHIAKKATLPSKNMLRNLRYKEIPKRLLIYNTVITGIYTIGVLASFYAATLVPSQYQLSASASSGLINGVATILLTLFVDPQAAIITDQALTGKRSTEDVKTLIILLLSTKLMGTLLGQLFIIPAATFIAYFYS